MSGEQLAAYAGTYEFGASSRAFSGLGLDVRLEDGQFKLMPIEGLPAARAGILAGDVVTQLNGTALKGSSLSSVVGKLRGAARQRGRADDRPQRTGSADRYDGGAQKTLAARVAAGRGRGLSVETIGGRRIFDFEGSKPATLIPLSNNEFYVDGRFATRLVFTRDRAGKVTGSILNPGRWEQAGVKID